MSASANRRRKEARAGPRSRVKISRQGAKSLTFSSGIREVDRLGKFPARISDRGARVHPRFTEAGRRSNPYLCYLTPAELTLAKKSTYADFLEQITLKTAQREDLEASKLSELLGRVEMIQKRVDRC